MMKGYESDYATRRAEKRKLRIYATDPMSGRRAPYRITIEVENETMLQVGPSGSLVSVIDYDGWNKHYYGQVNLDDPALLMEAGLAPSESDPRFHQQMVYAVAMKVIESARRALGRPVAFRKSSDKPTLRLFPHAFYGRNAFFDPELNAILFGYFQADANQPGENIPSQTVFTCLSHDIIAHEMTHAIVHKLRRYFLEATNVDVLAFHEAFADIVALFQRFSYRDLLIAHIQASEGGDLSKSAMLVELAQQFGQATGTGTALRSAIGEKPDPLALGKTTEPHKRGAILVSAVFAGYFRSFENRTADLLRIATGGSGRLPGGRLHPDLVNRLAAEAAQLSDRFLRMCFRAFDYLPPVDVTFGDFLRALVTSDYELNPADPDEVRFEIIEGFRKRGIFPAGVQSLAEEALLWPSQINGAMLNLPDDILQDARHYLALSGSALDQSRSSSKRQSRAATSEGDAALKYQNIEGSLDAEDGPRQPDDFRDKFFSRLGEYAHDNLAKLGLDPDGKVAVIGFHAVNRLSADQRLVIEFVAQFVQTDRERQTELAGLPFRAGATVIFGSEGEVRYIASKPMTSDKLPIEVQQAAETRLKTAKRFIEQLDLSDPTMAFASTQVLRERMRLRASFRSLHGED